MYTVSWSQPHCKAGLIMSTFTMSEVRTERIKDLSKVTPPGSRRLRVRSLCVSDVEVRTLAAFPSSFVRVPFGFLSAVPLVLSACHKAGDNSWREGSTCLASPHHVVVHARTILLAACQARGALQLLPGIPPPKAKSHFPRAPRVGRLLALQKTVLLMGDQVMACVATWATGLPKTD